MTSADNSAESLPLINIAIADDHELFRSGICHIINSFTNCRVMLEATDGRNLLNKLSRSDILPDICIIDLNMPVLNGYDTLEEIKKVIPQTKVLILTVHTESFVLQKLASMGANGYVVKNINPVQLNEAIRSVFKNGFYFYDPSKKKTVKQTDIKESPAINKGEMEFLKLCGKPISYEEIATIMHVSTRTIHSYQYDLTNKLKVNNRFGLALFAKDIGLA